MIDYNCAGIFERTIAVRIAETELCYVCIRFCCMPTMIVRDSMTVVFPKVEVPTITCVGFLKTMLDEREMACVTDFQVVCSQYPFLVHDRP